VLETGDGSFLLLRCQRIRHEGESPLVSCAIFSEHRRGSSVWADFGGLFGLTAAEAGLARRLADGELLTNVAMDLGITQETAKTHLRRIYAKIGVSRREEFYAKLLPFRVF
jgi:DNA-binding CsgD family transcriptional regulator